MAAEAFPLIMTPAYPTSPYGDVVVKLLLSLGLGLLVGLEREWANKDAGARSFAITALLGTLSVLLSPYFAMASMAGVFALVGFLNVRRLMIDRTLEVTTSIALIVTLVLGVLVGEGHYFTSISAGILMTILLTWKMELAEFADRLKPEEIRSAVILGLISFVIFPILPRAAVDPWGLFSPHEVWMTIIVVGSIGFVNYVLLKLYGANGFGYSAVLGGLVNSTAAIAELSETLRAATGDTMGMLISASLLTIFAMFIRNLVLLAILAPDAAAKAAVPLLAMAAAAAAIAWFKRGDSEMKPELKLSSPVSLKRLAAFGALFFVIQTLGTLAQRRLGGLGLLATSLVGGLFSSASTTAAAANLAARSQTTANVAAMATVLTSMVSATTNLPIIFRACGNGSRRTLILLTGLVLGVGAAACVALRFL
jgi:uncharacterized membrane protein (DUF4010 family)